MQHPLLQHHSPHIRPSLQPPGLPPPRPRPHPSVAASCPRNLAQVPSASLSVGAPAQHPAPEHDLRRGAAPHQSAGVRQRCVMRRLPSDAAKPRPRGLPRWLAGRVRRDEAGARRQRWLGSERRESEHNGEPGRRGGQLRETASECRGCGRGDRLHHRGDVSAECQGACPDGWPGRQVQHCRFRQGVCGQVVACQGACYGALGLLP